MEWLHQVEGLPGHAQWILSRHLRELRAVEGELKECMNRIEETTKEDRIVQELLTKKGIGLVTATIMRAEIGYFSRFSHGKQLSRFCGVTPKNCSSGERQADAGLIKAGNSILKTAIIEAAQRLVRYDPEWRLFATRLSKQGKPTCVVIGAVANRWIRKLCYIMHVVEANAPQELRKAA